MEIYLKCKVLCIDLERPIHDSGEGEVFKQLVTQRRN